MRAWMRVPGIVVAVAVLLSADSVGQIIASPPKREMRGAWIAAVTNLDWPSARWLTPQQQRDELVSILNGLSNAGINAVIFQIRPECDALYPSPYEPWSYWLTGVQGTAPTPVYDPLAFAVDEAHKRGMELHAWFNPYRAYRETNTYQTHATHVTKLHPEWVLTCPDGYKILDPGLPQSRDHIATVITDVVRRYGVDGIHMDDYFYPYPEHAFTNQDSASFADYSRGFPPDQKSDWRRDNVNIMIRQIRDSIEALKPWVKLGMSPFGIWKNGIPTGTGGMDAYSVIYCDAISWLQGGYIDYLVPQLYWQFGGAQDYGTLAPWWADSTMANGRHLYTGNATYRIAQDGWPASQIIQQLRFNQNEGNIHGSVQFRARSVTNNDGGIRDQLKSSVFRKGAAIPVMEWKETLAPEAPVNLVTQQDGATSRYRLSWDPPSPASDGDSAARYLVYRFFTSNPTVQDFNNGRHVLGIGGAARSFTPGAVIDTPGVQYSYTVTALDKNNNESPSPPVVTFPVSRPDAPSLLAPGDGSQTVTRTTALVWSRTAGTELYRTQMARSSGFEDTSIVLDVEMSDSSKSLPAVPGQSTFYWRVIAGNQGGSSESSAIYSFKTGWPMPPVAVSPSGINVPRMPTFVWRAFGGSSFNVRVVDNITKQTVLDTVVAETSFVCGRVLTGMRVHNWMVRALSPYGDSDWSPTLSFRTDALPPSFVESSGPVPERYSLAQNYPNPFNPSTTIAFELPHSGWTTLCLYNALGQQVRTLVNEELRAGRYTLTFGGEGLPSGMYVYVLVSGEYRTSLKMILLK